MDLDQIIPPEYIFGPRLSSISSSSLTQRHSNKPTSAINFSKREQQNAAGNQNARRDNPFNQHLSVEHYRAVEQHKVLFLSGRGLKALADPRQQNYCTMLALMCCPVLKKCSFTTLCMIVYLGVFIASVIVGLEQDGTLLKVQDSTLVQFGSNRPTLVRKGEVWRLIVAAVLHIDFNHLLGNFVSTIILLSHIEYTIGSLKSFILYLVSAIGANIFTDLLTPDTTKLGASTSLYGGLGFSIGYFIINYRGINVIGPVMKCQFICITFFILVFTILFSSVGGNIDYFGHLGGFITGFWLSFLHKPIEDNRRQKAIRIIFAILLVAQLAITFALFYTLDLGLTAD